MSPDSSYAPGATIPGTIYRVVRTLGEGGMGRVYEVSDTTLGKRYALKTLLGPTAQDREILVRMAIESRALVRLEHPNIVNVITAGVTSDGAFYYVMELLHGTTLREVLAARVRLEPRLAVPIALALARALERAHAEGVVHRDVKPDNVFLAMQANRTSRVKLVDFGVAGFLDALRGAQEQEGLMVGTPRYASPEQQRGERATTRMDIWSLGVVIFEMITGRSPFRSRSLTESFAEVQASEPAPRLSSVVRGLPERVSALVAAMLEKDPARRFGSMADVRRLLEMVQMTGLRDGTLSDIQPTEAHAMASSAGAVAPGTNRTLTAPGDGWAPAPRPPNRWSA